MLWKTAVEMEAGFIWACGAESQMSRIEFLCTSEYHAVFR